MVRLNGATGIHLLPLAPEQVAAYLRRDAGGPHTPAAARWNTVTTHLGTDTPVGQALSTPLGLFLARTIYNPRPHTRPGSGAVPHPDELCDTAAFPTRAALDTHLFNAFIPAAYTHHHPNPPRWSPPQAHRTLVLLARHLHAHHGGNPDLAWWELHHALPPHTPRRTVGLAFGLAAGLAVGLAVRPAVGLAAGLAVGLAARSMYPGAPSTQLRWSSDFLARRLAFGLTVGLVAGLVAGPAVGVAFGLAGALAGALKGDKPDLATMVGPTTLLTQDRRTFLTIGLLSGLVVGLMVELVVKLAVGLAGGLAFGLAFGLAAGLAETAAWVYFAVTAVHLAVRRRAPWNLMAFLRDAHEQRGVLRQVGAVYQFRHLDLQRHLAQQPWPPGT
jgi:hypothetical protein